MGSNSILDCSMFDPVTIDWIGRVNANSGTVSRATRKAIDKFVQAGKLNGWWTKCKRINLFAGDQLAAALVPLLVGGGNATETNNNFVSGDYTLPGGLTGNSSNKSLLTGWVPSVELSTILNAHYGIAVLARCTSGSFAAYLGAEDGSKEFQCRYLSGSTNQNFLLGTGNSNKSAAASALQGHLAHSVTASATGGSYQDGTLLQNAASITADNRPTVQVAVFSNYTSAPTAWANATLGGYHFGTGLSATDVTNMYNAINTFCTAIGRTLP